jgi:hypothetical protein
MGAIIEVRNLSKKAALPLLTTFPLRSIRRNFWFSWGRSRKNNCHENAHRDLHAYFGEAVVAGYNVKSATEMVKKSIGYEPKILHV